MSNNFYLQVSGELRDIAASGLYKTERVIATRQGATIRTVGGTEVTNLCANNYLGLSSHPRVVEAALDALHTHGYGLSSVRFICGTQDLHKRLEKTIADRRPGYADYTRRTNAFFPGPPASLR